MIHRQHTHTHTHAHLGTSKIKQDRKEQARRERKRERERGTRAVAHSGALKPHRRKPRPMAASRCFTRAWQRTAGAGTTAAGADHGTNDRYSLLHTDCKYAQRRLWLLSFPGALEVWLSRSVAGGCGGWGVLGL